MFKALLKPLDLVIIALSAAAIILLSISIYAPDGGEPSLRIESAGGDYIYPLDEDRRIDIEGPSGTSSIVIENGSAYFEDSDCRDKLCVLMGKISEEGQWAACMPNRVFISIEGDSVEEIDVLSY